MDNCGSCVQISCTTNKWMVNAELSNIVFAGVHHGRVGGMVS